MEAASNIQLTIFCGYVTKSDIAFASGHITAKNNANMLSLLNSMEIFAKKNKEWAMALKLSKNKTYFPYNEAIFFINEITDGEVDITPVIQPVKIIKKRPFGEDALNPVGKRPFGEDALNPVFFGQTLSITQSRGVIKKKDLAGMLGVYPDFFAMKAFDNLTVEGVKKTLSEIYGDDFKFAFPTALSIRNTTKK